MAAKVRRRRLALDALPLTGDQLDHRHNVLATWALNSSTDSSRRSIARPTTNPISLSSLSPGKAAAAKLLGAVAPLEAARGAQDGTDRLVDAEPLLAAGGDDATLHTADTGLF